MNPHTMLRNHAPLFAALLLLSACNSAPPATPPLAGAAIGGYFVLLFLSIALWWSLGEAIGHGWSALVVTVIWAIIAAALAVLGRTALRKARGLPQTTDTVKNIPGALTPHPQEKS